MGWNKCNKFLLKKNKGQGVLTPAQNKQLQFKRTLCCNKKNFIRWKDMTRINSLYFVLFVFFFMLYRPRVPLIWFKRNLKKNNRKRKLTVFF